MKNRRIGKGGSVYAGEGGVSEKELSNTREIRWWHILILLTGAGVVGWYMFFGPQCVYAARGTAVVGAKDGSAYCIADRMVKGGFSTPERCFESKEEAEELLKTRKSEDNEQFQACKRKLDDHFALGPVRRWITRDQE